MENDHNVRLTSAELSNLWTQFMNDSMAACVLTHFLKHVEDKEIREILLFASDLSHSHLPIIKRFFTQENYPIPVGFTTSDDVYLDAPPLFTDIFMIIYMYVMTLHGLTGYAGGLSTSVREDQITYFTKCNSETMELYARVVKVMLNKGIVSRAPFINPPKGVDFVKKQSFLTGWFGKRRPLNAIEISGICYNTQKTSVKAVLEMGFSQVATSKELRQYFHRGANICEKQFETLNNLLSANHLPAPRKWTSEVTNSTVPPFSDKLMLFHIVSLISTAVGYLGAGLAISQRRDLSAIYELLIAEIGLYAEDGANLLIENGWLEQPPMADDRDKLANIE
ncbi:MAG TPA: DUF3231 family protein [Pseudoneobacillus sp.]|nr:DUF3231 family protein [Pseudoneobacillus sp.]